MAERVRRLELSLLLSLGTVDTLQRSLQSSLDTIHHLENALQISQSLLRETLMAVGIAPDRIEQILGEVAVTAEGATALDPPEQVPGQERDGDPTQPGLNGSHWQRSRRYRIRLPQEEHPNDPPGET